MPDPTPAMLAQRNRELSILNHIAEALNREVDLDRALASALAHVAELLDLETGWIWLKQPTSGSFYLAAAQKLPTALADHPHRMEGGCYCLDSYDEGDLAGAANVNVVRCSRLKELPGIDTGGLSHHATIPLYAHGKALGVLNVASADWRELDSDTLRLLHTIGELLSIAIERARLFEESTRLGAVAERNRLAREIHDGLAQGLAAIALQLEAAEELLDSQSSNQAARRAVGQALAQTRQSMDEARRSVLDLRAAPLEGHTLAEALARLVATVRSPALDVALDITGAARPLPVRVEVALFRVAQEALTNVQRHAGARHVAVSLVATAQAATLTIKDDGNGFDAGAIPPGHFGLIGMNERLRLLGGTLTLHSAPTRGTRLRARVPLAAR